MSKENGDGFSNFGDFSPFNEVNQQGKEDEFKFEDEFEVGPSLEVGVGSTNFNTFDSAKQEGEGDEFDKFGDSKGDEFDKFGDSKGDEHGFSVEQQGGGDEFGTFEDGKGDDNEFSDFGEFSPFNGVEQQGGGDEFSQFEESSSFNSVEQQAGEDEFSKFGDGFSGLTVPNPTPNLDLEPALELPKVPLPSIDPVTSVFSGTDDEVLASITQIFANAFSDITPHNQETQTFNRDLDIVSLLTNSTPDSACKHCNACGCKIPPESIGCMVCGTKTDLDLEVQRLGVVPPLIDGLFWVALGISREVTISKPSPPPIPSRVASEQYISPTAPPPQAVSPARSQPLDLGNLDFLDSWNSQPHLQIKQTPIPDPQNNFFLGPKPSSTTITSTISAISVVTSHLVSNAELFINRIPDLSFMVSDTLVLPNKQIN